MLSKDLHAKKIQNPPLPPLIRGVRGTLSTFRKRGTPSRFTGSFTKSLVTFSILIIVISFAGCTGSSVTARSGQVTLTVSAAADLTYAFQDIGEAFEQETGAKVVFNFGSSGQLAQQIREGAPVDVFASASLNFVEELEKRGLIIPGTSLIYARGRIGLWPRDNAPFYPQSIQDLARPEIKRIAIANPEHAPYGMAAMQALQSSGIRESVKPKLVMGENASQTLQYAKTGNADVVIVPLSLVIQNANPYWVVIPENLHKPIDQALGIMKTTPHEKAARQFIALVNSPRGRDIMRKYGFILPGEDS